MFYHAYNSYLENAYPYDELRPLTCDGQDTWGRYEFTAETFLFFNNKENKRTAHTATTLSNCI